MKPSPSELAPDAWICTASGRRVWPLAMDSGQIDLEDIAASLSRQCRFGGHCRAFYSVAQHAVHVAALLQTQGPEAALAGLLHDAAEAYLVDLPGPVKRAAGLEGYREAEERLNEAIATRFGLTYPFPRCVKEADRAMLAAELRDLMPAAALEAIPLDVVPRAARVRPWSPRRAQRAFKAAFQVYEGRRHLGEEGS